MRTRVRMAAGVAALALLATACGDAPEDEATGDAAPDDNGTDTGEPADADVGAACMITDTGGVDDRSFNETSWAGVEQAEDEFGVEAKLLESSAETDFEPNMSAFLEDDCSLIVTVGFLLGDATRTAAENNPDQDFAIVDFDFADYDADGNFEADVTLDNVRELTFATDQAAFLAGYVAADATETGTIGTYGGVPIPTVTIFMDGLLAGVRHYNEVNGTDVEVIGWDGSDGQFTGNFESQDDGRNLTDQLLAEGADIIMPVAGPVGLGSAAALRDSGAEDLLIWVDTDGFESAAEYGDLMLTSVMKNMDVAVRDTIATVVDDSFEGGLYVGTLENDGVGIADFHDQADRVSDETKAALEDLRAGIIDGSISVSSADYAG